MPTSTSATLELADSFCGKQASVRHVGPAIAAQRCPNDPERKILLPPETRGRLEALVESMRARLRPLCVDWPQDAFEEMVLRLAEITLKYEGKATSGIYDRRSTDSLREETRTLLEAADKSRKAGESNQ